MSDTSLNMDVQISQQENLVFFGYTSRRDVTGPCGSLMFSFKETLSTDFHSGYANFISPSVMDRGLL